MPALVMLCWQACDATNAELSIAHADAKLQPAEVLGLRVPQGLTAGLLQDVSRAGNTAQHQRGTCPDWTRKYQALLYQDAS